MTQSATNESKEVPGVNDLDEWDQESCEEEHNGLLFYHSVALLVDVVETDILDEQCHQGSCEEQSESVF